MVIGRDLWEALVDHARAAAPNEACGLLAAESGTVHRFYPIDNVDASPVHYSMEPKQQLRAMLEIEDNEWELVIYHSHTHTPARPSPEDRRLAFYPDALYAILSLADPERPVLRVYRITGSAAADVREEPVEFTATAPAGSPHDAA